MPAAPLLNDPNEIEDAHDYAGVFRSAEGRELTFKTDGKRLLLMHGNEEIVLQRSAGDTFSIDAAGSVRGLQSHVRQKQAGSRGARASPRG